MKCTKGSIMLLRDVSVFAGGRRVNLKLLHHFLLKQHQERVCRQFVCLQICYEYKLVGY